MCATDRNQREADLLRLTLGLAAIAVFTCVEARGVTPPGTIISNQASVALVTASGTRAVFLSNPDRFEVAQGLTPVQVDVLRRDPDSNQRLSLFAARYRDGIDPASSEPIPLPADFPSNPDGSVTVSYRPSTAFRSSELILVRVTDSNRNHDAHGIDTVTVELTATGGLDTEIIELLETGNNAGVFAGFVTASVGEPRSFDGHVSVNPDSGFRISYVDEDDADDRATIDVLVDPYGIVFDTATGEPISGVAVTLVNAATGQPAEVFGLDGSSAYPSTVVAGEPVRDASGATYSMPPGRFVFPFVAPGSYYYRVTFPERSGYTFPTSIPDGELATLPGAPFALGPGARGEPFSVVLDPVAMDVPLDPNAGMLVLSMRARTPTAGIGDFIAYTIEASNQRALQPFASVEIANTLPVGFRLEKTSLRLNDAPATAEVESNGRSFALTVPQIQPGETARISYVAHAAASRAGPATNRAVAAAGLLRSNEATATVTIQDDLMSTRSHILGRVVRFQEGRSTDQGIAGAAVYLETGAMTVSDERGFFRFEGVRPGVHVVQLDLTTLPENARPILPHDSTQAAGRAWSRFVDLAPGTAWNVEFVVDVSGLDQLDAPGETHSTALEASDAGITSHQASPVYDRDWIEAEPESYDWILPRDGASPATPVIRILVKHFPAQRVNAFLNGAPVNPTNFDGTLTNRSKTVAASLWSGVNLVEGDNELEIVRIDSFGIERDREKRVIHFASPPVRAEFAPSESTLVADGVTPPVIAVRLFDRDDHPARPGVKGRVTVRKPYTFFREDIVDIRLQPGTAPVPDEYVIGEDGLARIKLRPTTTSGTVHLALSLVTGEHELRADLHGDRKSWILVGVTEGTQAYETISGNLESARSEDLGEGWDTDGRVAFFAKGRIRGGWLLTAAYDSDKETDRPRSLHGEIDPDAYYTVYGDESKRLEAAPSSGKLYVKLERGAVSALFGDFTLDWTTTAFTTYARDLHGVAVDYRGARIRGSAFQSDAGLTFARDEIRGNGLSGPYPLSRQNLVPFSERVVLEVRDSHRPDLVLEQTPLSRNVDYTIDYYAGTVRLSEPLFANSTNLQPQFLVVRYEMEDDTTGVVTGGRVEFVPSEKVLVGAAHVAEQHDGRTSSVSGVDTRIALTPHVTLLAEAARSDDAADTAHAYRAEIWHRTEASDTRAYFRDVGEGFGLGQLNSAQTGNRQIGIEGTQRFSRRLALRELLYRETVFATGDQREAGELQLELTEGPWSVRSGAKAARDERNDGQVHESVLATLGVSRRLFQDRLALRVDREQSVKGEAENLDFPTRTVVGARYALNTDTSLRVEHEWTEARHRETNQSRIGIESTPWTGGRVTGALMQSYGASASTLLGSGIKQTVQVTPELGLEGGFERSQVIGGGTSAESDPGAPTPFHPTSGFSSVAQGNALSMFAGAHWKPASILYNARAEVSDTDQSRRIGFLASAQAEPRNDLGVLASLIVFRQTIATGAPTSHLDLRLGAAWRPETGSTFVLNRFDIVRSPSAGGGSHAWKVIENAHVNHAFGDVAQMSLNLGAKYTWDSWEENEFTSLTTLVGVEVRRNLGAQWDIGLHGAVLSGWRANIQRSSAGVSIGRSFARNTWASVGFNFTGFRDADFDAGRYTNPGLFVRFRLKFDQESLAGLLRMIGEE